MNSEMNIVEFIRNANEFIRNTDDRHYFPTEEISGTGFVVGKILPYESYKLIEYHLGNQADESAILDYYSYNYNRGNLDTYRCFSCGFCKMMKAGSIVVDPVTGSLNFEEIIPRYIETSKYFIVENSSKNTSGHIIAVSKKHQYNFSIFYDVELLIDLHQILKKSGSVALMNGYMSPDPYHHHVYIVDVKIPALWYASRAIDSHPDQSYIEFAWGNTGLKTVVIHGNPSDVGIWMNKYYNYAIYQKKNRHIVATIAVRPDDNSKLMVVLYLMRQSGIDKYGLQLPIVPTLNFIDIISIPHANMDDINEIKQIIKKFSQDLFDHQFDKNDVEKMPIIQSSKPNNLQDISTNIYNAVGMENMLLFEQVVSSILTNAFQNEGKTQMGEIINIFDKAIMYYGRQRDTIDSKTVYFAMGKEFLTLGYLSTAIFPNSINKKWIEKASIFNQQNRSKYMSLQLDNFFIRGKEFNEQVMNIFKDYINITLKYQDTTINGNNINNWLQYTGKKIGEKSQFGIIMEAQTRVSNTSVILKIQDNKNSDRIKYESLVHQEINKMRDYIPNIPIFYGTFNCNMILDSESPIELCPIVGNNFSNIMIIEMIKGMSFNRYILSDHIDEYTIMTIIQQIMCVLELMQQKFKFSHNDLHLNNIMLTYLYNITELNGKDIIFKYNIENGVVQAIRTNYLVSLIDFGQASTANSRPNIPENIFDYLRDDYNIDMQTFNPLSDAWNFMTQTYLYLVYKHPKLLYPKHVSGQSVDISSSFIARVFDIFFTAFSNLFESSHKSIYDTISIFLSEPNESIRLNKFEKLVFSFNNNIKNQYQSKKTHGIHKLPPSFSASHIQPVWFNSEKYIMNSPAKIGLLFSQNIYVKRDSIIYRWSLTGKTGREYNYDENMEIKKKENEHKKLINIAKSLTNITNGRLICEIDGDQINVVDMKECYDMIYYRKSMQTS